MGGIEADHPDFQLGENFRSGKGIDPDVELGGLAGVGDVAEGTAAHDDEALEVLGQVGMEAQAGGDIGQRTDGHQYQLAAVANGFLIDDLPGRLGIGLLLDFAKLDGAYTCAAMDTGSVAVPGIEQGLFGAETNAAVDVQQVTQTEDIAAGQVGRDIAFDRGDGDEIQQLAGIGQRQGVAVVNAGIAVDNEGDLFHSGNLRCCILPLS